MASFDTIQKLNEHPEWIHPRSDVRVFLGEPGGPEANKTTVEPGNSFSPGMKTFGVSWWLRFPDTDAFFTPEEALLENLNWHYLDGIYPLIQCETQVEGVMVQNSIFQDGSHEDRSEAVSAQLTLINLQAVDIRLEVFIPLRSLGPAGGPIHTLAVGASQQSFWIDQPKRPLIGFDRLPDAIGCGIGDPSSDFKRGAIPSESSVTDPAGWCFGLARFDLILIPGELWRLTYDCPLVTHGFLADQLPATVSLHTEQFTERVTEMRRTWQSFYGHIELDVPDDIFRQAFYAGLQHMLTAVVDDQARIAPLSYPLPWLRDSVIIIRCFDLAGLHDLARSATAYCARNDFFGGFGAEGDAPGQGIWALVQHYRITKENNWLAEVYPAIQRKCDWLFRMRRTEKNIRVPVDTPVLPASHAQRNANTICLSAQDGLIQGVMDHGVTYSLGWVNQWAYCGLLEAAYAARILGDEVCANSYETEATEIFNSIKKYADENPEFFLHERTVNSLLWPSRTWENDLQTAQTGFEMFWGKYREKDGRYLSEPYWLYFEFAQAHNALLLGQRERAWRVIEYRLKHQDLPGLFGWREGGEGVGTENATLGVTLINQLRGCHKFESITPHGWSQSEMWLLQRAVLIEEWGQGLTLFSGVPSHWIKPGKRIAFRGFPTWYGKASADLRVSPDGKSANIIVSGVKPGTKLTIQLPSKTVHVDAKDEEITIKLDL